MSNLSLAAVFLLVIPVALFNVRYGLNNNAKMVYALFRMTLQLSVIGVVLQLFFNLNNPFINFIYVLLMMTVACHAMLKSTNLPIKDFGLPIWLAVFIPHVVVLLFFNFMVKGANHTFDAQYLIPIGGMLLGNSLSGNILAISNFYSRLRDQEKLYYYTLGLSANRKEALKPYFKQALLSSINPTLASIETIGLVALPGMMTGQILGGSIPLTAIKYQIAIMVAIFVTRYFTAILAIKLTSTKAFDGYDRLLPNVKGS